MKEIYRIKTAAAAKKDACVIFENIRITVLTQGLVRLEWNPPLHAFTDLPTQKVWNRNFEEISFTKTEKDGCLAVETGRLKIEVKKAETLRESVKIILKNPCGSVKSWRYGDRIETLKGTARTLDNADGAIELEEGIISREGISVLDDSNSYLINEDGTLRARGLEGGTGELAGGTSGIDVYLFAYGHDYKACLRDYLTLTGKPPLLPRFALGNWWSRFYRYTQAEYLELMERFQKEKIPLSVAVIDIDWHPTKIEKSLGTGWTGFSWNRELFPDPEFFLNELHKKNLRVSLNIHPAEGVARHEDEYANMKKELGLENDGKTVPFDITNPAFVEAYFKVLHYPLEKEGVDFWWIDWQQGEKSDKPGLDPLWLLNHYYFLDNAKEKRRPLILSRYSGPGSHRYPVGFSGDTIISWKSLQFQPYFTATASNIGYGWWSHDIGGHMMGTYDEELQVRWAQFGVFSPIMRLHCSSGPFNHKEPWKYGFEANKIISDFMRLRHRLLPYLYTMNQRFTREGLPLITPLYYDFPENKEAYDLLNEYNFGSELICAPVTDKINRDLGLAKTKVWLPFGSYTDIFTGITYDGKKTLNMYRPLDKIPLLLKAGGILPLAAESEIMGNKTFPENFDIYVSPGNEGHFTLYEDDGDSLSCKDGKYVRTSFILQQDSERGGTFTIEMPDGQKNLLPEERFYRIHFMNSDLMKSAKEGKKQLEITRISEKRENIVEIRVKKGKKACINYEVYSWNEDFEKEIRSLKIQRCFNLLDKAQIDFSEKEAIYNILGKYDSVKTIVRQLQIRHTNQDFIEALSELLENY